MNYMMDRLSRVEVRDRWQDMTMSPFISYHISIIILSHLVDILWA